MPYDTYFTNMCPITDNYSLIADFYSEHRDELVAYVTKRIGTDYMADDIVQDVFLRLLTSQQLLSGVTLPSLVYTMTKNLILDRWRHMHAIQQFEHFIKTNNHDGSYDPSSVYSVQEMLELLERGMARLDEKQQTVYKMNVYDAYKVSEISNTLQVNYKSVENTLGTARKVMRNYMRRMLA